MTDDQRVTATEWIRDASRIVALTGAGISTDSGIPDFRGPQGVWTKDPAAQGMFTLSAYLADPALRRSAWVNRLAHPAWTAEPNAGHSALVDLERSGRLRALVTQNIDSLHRRAGTSPELLVEIHGSLLEAECLGECGQRQPMRVVLDRVEAGEDDPPCRTCGGILKSATISFGQALRPADVDRAWRAAQECDLFLAVGTSLTVQPVALLPRLASDHGARVVIINAEPTPYDALADAVIREPISEVLPALVAAA